MNYTFSTRKIFGWLFAFIFVMIGVLNLIFIHPLPGVFYLLLSLIFLPPVNEFFRNKFRFSIPFVVKVILFIAIMWPTLAVGDLAEMLGL